LPLLSSALQSYKPLTTNKVPFCRFHGVKRKEQAISNHVKAEDDKGDISRNREDVEKATLVRDLSIMESLPEET